MSNPFAYYDDEPLPANSKSLSVSDDGEALPDREPRYPIVLQGNFISFFKPAIRAYRIEVNIDLFECRLPNGEFVQWSREDARKRLEIRGEKIYLTLPGKVYCFKKINRVHDLDFARLKTWLMLPDLVSDNAADDTDADIADEAYRQVRRHLQRGYFGPLLFLAIALCYCVFAVIEFDYLVHTTGNNNASISACLFGGVLFLARGTSILALVILLIQCGVKGEVNLRLLRFTAVLGMVFLFCIIVGFRLHSDFGAVFFTVWPPCYLYGQYRQWRKSERQLQRENGLA